MTDQPVQTLADVIPVELKRCRELLNEYKRIGPAGAFGALMIELAIQRADKASAGGDVIEMLAAYQELKALE